MGCAHHERADFLEVPKDGAGQGRAFFRVGAGAQFVHQHQRMDRGPGHYVFQVGDVGAEGGQRLLDALLVADVCVYTVEPGEMGLFGGHMQAGLGHHRQQSHRFQRYGLASGVGTGDQHHPVVAVQVDAHWDDRASEQRVAGPDQSQMTVRHLLVGDPWGHRIRGGRVTALGHVQVKSRHQVQRQHQVFSRHSHHPGQLAQHPVHLPFLGQPGLPPAVAHVDGRHGLDEYRGPAVGHVVDDARHPVAQLRLDQQHHPAVALGDQRFLDHLRPLQAAQVPLHDFIEPVLGLPRVPAQVVQHGAGVVQNLPGRADRARDGPLQVA